LVGGEAFESVAAAIPIAKRGPVAWTPQQPQPGAEDGT